MEKEENKKPVDETKKKEEVKPKRVKAYGDPIIEMFW